MGCGLGKPAGAGAGHSRRDNTATVDGANNVVKVREKQETEAPNAGELSGNIPAPKFRQLRLNSFTATQQSWPPWLMDVAGDAIRDWTPRRANTFEKLSKVSCFIFLQESKYRYKLTNKGFEF